MRITLAERGSSDWARSADLARLVFSRSFGANVDPDPDFFLSCFEQQEDGTEEALSTTALTLPETGDLLLEKYLDMTLEEAIALDRGLETPPRRKEILQIGSIASIRATAGAEIIKAVPLVMICLGRAYAAMTMTSRLVALMQRMGVVFYPLAEADPTRLAPGELERWGTYYDHRPVVGYSLGREQTALLSGSTGRYLFSSVDMRLLPSRERELARAA